MEQKTALVTGTRTGIGCHLARHLLESGYRVVGCSRRPAGWSAEGFEHHCVDVTDEKAVKHLLSQLLKTRRRLDVLVNCAGTASMNHCLLTPADTLRQMLDTNVVGTFIVSREAAKLMRRERSGRIVNLSSVAVPLRLAGQAAYVASKAAVESLSRVMAAELARDGITVNVIGPGPVATDMTRGVPEDKLARLVERLPLGRMSTMDDITSSCDLLLGPAGAAITGQVIYLGGA